MPAYCSFMFPTCIKHKENILPVYLCREDCISVKKNYCNLDGLIDSDRLELLLFKVIQNIINIKEVEVKLPRVYYKHFCTLKNNFRVVNIKHIRFTLLPENIVNE